MPAKYLVALDGSATSESVLPFVTTLLRRQKADLTLATVSRPGKTGETTAGRTYLDQIVDRLRKQGAKVKALTLSGRPAEALTACASSGGFDLLALCSHGRSGLKRLLFGSVAEGVLRSARTPVLVVPPAGRRKAPSAFRTIVLPHDGSHRSASVLKPAAALAKAFGAKLHLVTVVSPTKKEDLPVETVGHNLFGDQKKLRRKGLVAKVSILYGDPAERIRAFAEEKKADLIALATHGRSGLGKLLGGSVAESLLRKGRCAMLVVRSDAVPKTRPASPAAFRARRRALRTLAKVGEVKKGPYNK